MMLATYAAISRHTLGEYRMSAKRIDRQIDLETGNVTFTVVGTGQALVANPADYISHTAEEIKEFLGDIGWRMLAHATNNKIGDSAASVDVDAMEAMTSTRDQLVAGAWNTRGGGGAARVTVLAEAMFSVQNGSRTLDDIVDQLDAMSKEQRRDIPKKYAKVKSAMEEIKAKRATEKAKVAKKAAVSDDSDMDELFA